MDGTLTCPHCGNHIRLHAMEDDRQIWNRSEEAGLAYTQGHGDGWVAGWAHADAEHEGKRIDYPVEYYQEKHGV